MVHRIGLSDPRTRGSFFYQVGFWLCRSSLVGFQIDQEWESDVHWLLGPFLIKSTSKNAPPGGFFSFRKICATHSPILGEYLQGQVQQVYIYLDGLSACQTESCYGTD